MKLKNKGLKLTEIVNGVKQRIVRNTFDNLSSSSPLPAAESRPIPQLAPTEPQSDTGFYRYHGGNQEQDSTAFRLLLKLMYDASASVYEQTQTVSDADIMPMQQATLDRLAVLSDPASSEHHHKVRCLQQQGLMVSADFFWQYAQERMGNLVVADMQTEWLAQAPVLCDVRLFPFEDRSVIVSIGAQRHADLRFFDDFLFAHADRFQQYLSESRERVQQMIAQLEAVNPLDARNREFELQKTESLNRSNFATLFQSFAHNHFLLAKDMRFVLTVLTNSVQQENLRQAFDAFLNESEPNGAAS